MAALRVRDLGISCPTNVSLCIQKYEPGRRFELKQIVMQILHTMQMEFFYGLSHKDPTIHIDNFLEISDFYTAIGVNKYYVRLTLFPFSLRWKQKDG